MFKKIAVLGAGTMGRGIAQVFARHGMNTVIFDPRMEAIAEAKSKLGSENLQYADKLAGAIENADLIIESVSENLEIKRELYREMAPFLTNTAIVASNTSTFSLELLADQQPFADRMIIAHFFNPAEIIPLVEIVQLESTQQGITDKVIALLNSCGKAPVRLKKDIAGFIANRLQAAVMREASYLLDSGVADAADIDKAMKDGIGIRWALNGPFEIADLGGLDIWEKVTGHLFPRLANSQIAPESIQAKVQAGELGLKSGKGFYEYGESEERDKLSYDRDQKLKQLIKLKRL